MATNKVLCECCLWLVRTVDVLLLLGGHDRQQVTPTRAAVLLSSIPALPAAEVTITEALELVPAEFAHLQV